MEVIFVNRFYYPDESATAQMLADLAEQLVRSGYSTTVICSRSCYRASDSNLASRESVNGVRVIRTGLSFLPASGILSRLISYLTFMLAAGWNACRLSNSNSCLVVKTDPPLMSVVGWVVCGLRKCVLVNWLQDIFPEVVFALHGRKVTPVLGAMLVKLRNWSLRAAYRNVVLGDAMRKVLLAEGIPDSRITIIPNWSCGSALYPTPVAENRFRKSWGLADKFVISYSGNLGRVHDLTAIVDLASELSNNDKIVFLIIGDGAQLEAIRDNIRQRELNNVLFKPFQMRQDLRDSLGCADLHITSLKPNMEGLVLPSKIYGILAVGRPIIHLGDTEGEIATLLSENDCGRCFSAANINGISAYIEGLADRSDVLRRLGSNARKLFLDRYEFRHSAKKWRSVLDGCRIVSP